MNKKVNINPKQGNVMQVQARVHNGEYGGKPVNDLTFPLVKGFNVGKNGGFITVDGAHVPGFPDREIRIKLVSKNDYEVVNSFQAQVEENSKEETVKTPVIVKEEKSDEERIKEIAERFEILDEMTQGSIDGVVRGMIVTGPPGIGKSFGVEKVIEKNSMFDKLADKPLKYGTEKGAASAIGLYQLLYRYADPGSVLVLDDCDSILWDEVSLNLLKAALDSSAKRMISWNTESSALRREGVPEKFEFCGSVVFITNLKFDNVKKGKLKDHLEAILSRCHYLDLTLDTMHDKLLRVKQIVGDGMLKKYNFSKDEEVGLINYMEENKEKLREMSLRMVNKIADLKKMAPERWMRLAESTCMKRN
ncbi:uncharacterized protein METZ01_LOCUS166023 [marine metagenome]|uniref:ATPase AAA-type core domain-containing protein n=1 Tax=marine metagenome TaxID=408172 RepID=A0A382BHT3_9ZZZZ